MKPSRKFHIRTLTCTGIILVILAALFFTLPGVLNSESVKGKIRTRISREIGAAVNFQRIDVSFFPRPHMEFARASFSFPGKAEGTFGSLVITPRLLPLLFGEVRIDRVLIRTPHASVMVPEREKKKISLSVSEIEEKITALLNAVEEDVPGLAIDIERGDLAISDPKGLLFWFREMGGRIMFPPGEAGIALTCSSNFSEKVSLDVRLDKKDFRGSGTVKLRGMKPRHIVDYLFPESAWRLGDSEGDLTLSLRTLGAKDLRADIHASLPSLTLLHGNRKVLLKGVGIGSSLARAGDEDKVTVTELKLEYPQLALSGVFIVSAQNVALDLTGRNVDVPAVRGVALSMAGEVPIIHDIFEYVKGGRVPLITFRSHGASPEDLGKTNSISITSTMERGEVFIPGPKLDFMEVDADCVISRGILEGKSVKARLGNSEVRDGKVRVGLKGKDVPLHVDAEVKADLTEARDMLRRLIKNEPLQKEIDLVSDIRGEARGRVIIGENTASLKPIIDLSAMAFSAEYRRLPLPLLIRAGRFFYDETQTGVQGLDGTLGRSSFKGLTGKVRLEESPYLEISSGSARIDQDEIYPWLKSFESLRGPLQDVRSVRGAAFIDTLSLRGPLLKPEEWHFTLAGGLEDLVVDWAFLPGPVSLRKGTVAADDESISLTDAGAEILDSSVTLSGSRRGYRKGHPRTDLAFHGQIGPQLLQWTGRLADIPPEIALDHPVDFEHAHLALEEGTTLFEGKWKVQDGPEITADVLRNPGGLAIRKLTLTDATSDAALSLDLREKTVSLAFAGKLTSETFHKIVAEKGLAEGGVSGNFRAEIQREKPFHFSAHGTLGAENISFSLKDSVPLRIEHLSVSGYEDRLSVESASVKINGLPLSLRGVLHWTSEGTVIDTDLSADRIEWRKIEEIIEELGKGKKEQNTWNLPVQGWVRLRAHSFAYDNFVWTPFEADIEVHPNDIDIAVMKAELCGISSPGSLSVAPGSLSLDFQFSAKNRELKPALACLGRTGSDITGTFDLKASVKGHATGKELSDSLGGNMEFSAKDGRIYKGLAILKIFDFLEINQILSGFSEMRKEGLAYQTIKAKGQLEKSVLKTKELVIDGRSVKLAAVGSADLKDKKVDFTVLVCPLRRIDLIISKIPVVGRILGSSLVSIPVRVTGDLDNPKVSFEPVSAVGLGLFGIIKRTVETPVRLFDPFLRKKKE